MLARKPRLTLSLFLVGTVCAAMFPAFGQQPAPTGASSHPDIPAATKPLTFDVVSIRVNNSGQMGNAMRGTPDGFIYTNSTLQSLIGGTYGNRPDLISGLPDWAQTTRYDIQAKVDPENVDAYRKLKGAESRRMYQALLEDRFKLITHIETKEEPIYELVIAKGGPKLHESKPGDTYENGLKGPDGKPMAGPGGRFGRGEFTVQQTGIGGILLQLQSASGRSVVDKTGLTGKYDITLHWEPTSRSAGPDDAPSDTSGPSIFSALEEQLGLKLQPAKGPVKSLVIDHIEKPSEN